MKITIVNAWNWFCNVLDTQTLTASEQLILLHIMKFLNRNFWKPTPITISALSRSCSKDSRTVRETLTRLQTRNLIYVTEVGINLGFQEPVISNKANVSDKPKKTTSSSFSKKNSTNTNELVDFDREKNLNGITASPLITENLITELRNNGGTFKNQEDLDYFNKLNPLSQKKILERINLTH